jgi:hypothetical protein
VYDDKKRMRRRVGADNVIAGYTPCPAAMEGVPLRSDPSLPLWRISCPGYYVRSHDVVARMRYVVVHSGRLERGGHHGHKHVVSHQ